MKNVLKYYSITCKKLKKSEMNIKRNNYVKNARHEMINKIPNITRKI
jgi:hypothetical protein